MKTYFFSPEGFHAWETDFFRYLFEKNISGIHIHKPASKETELGHLLEKIPMELLPSLSLHQHKNLLKHFPMLKWHSNRQEINTLLKTAYPFEVDSYSHHQRSEKTVKIKANHSFICPLFDSISKKNHPSQWTHEDIVQLLSEHPDKLWVGLGGIQADSIPELKKLGLKAVAIKGYLYQNTPTLKEIKARSEEILCQT